MIKSKEKEKEIRNNKKYYIPCGKNCRTYFSCCTKNEPEVCFISIKAWVSPKFYSDDYKNNVALIDRKIRNGIAKALSNSSIYCTKFISDLDLATDVLDENRYSFAQYDIYIKQKEYKIHDIKKLKDLSIEEIKFVTDKFEEAFNDNDFKLSPSKVR